MIKTKIANSYDKDRIYQFLKCTKYRRFNLWPNITNDCIAKFLFEEINKIKNSGKTIIATLNNEIAALLAFDNLNWDTQHFGFKCTKIEYFLTSTNIDNSIIEKSLEQILIKLQKYCLESNIKFVAVSIDSWDIITNLALQKSGFRYILTWIDGIFTDFNKLSLIKDDVEVSIIKPEEIDYFTKIFSINYFIGGRFYFDNNFKIQLVDKMYANLIKNSYENNDIMIVYRIKKQPMGLFICPIVNYNSFSNLKVAIIRFVIIDPEFRNKKVGYNLFVRTIKHLKDKSDIITTGLEIHNLPSLNLHSKIGFKFNYTHNVYHWWASKKSYYF